MTLKDEIEGNEYIIKDIVTVEKKETKIDVTKLSAVKSGVSDSTSFIFYMLYINNGSCLLNEIYKLSGISKQTINSAESL